MKAFNINEIIKVKLTDYGKDIYYHQCDEFNKKVGYEAIKPRFPKVDKDGFTEFQLWNFMEVYGPHMRIGMSNIIEHNDIYIGDEYLREVELNGI